MEFNAKKCKVLRVTRIRSIDNGTITLMELSETVLMLRKTWGF